MALFRSCLPFKLSHYLILLFLIIVPLFFITRCNDGIDRYYRIPFEPPKKFRLEIQIDHDNGKPAKWLAYGVYAIDFSPDGVAVVDSVDAIRGWAAQWIITPTRKLRNGGECSIVGSWEMAYVSERSPRGGMLSYTVEDGSKFIMDVEIYDEPFGRGRKVEKE